MKMKLRKGKSWDEKIFDELSNSRWFVDKCEEIKQKYNKSKDWFLLKNEVDELCKFIAIPGYWNISIRNYIKDGNLKLPKLSGANIIANRGLQNRNLELFIQIYRHTTQEDVLRIWKDVEICQKGLREIWVRSLEDLEVLKIWNEVLGWPKRPRNIASQVEAELRKKGISLSQGDIRKRVSRMKKQVGETKKPVKTTA